MNQIANKTASLPEDFRDWSAAQWAGFIAAKQSPLRTTPEIDKIAAALVGALKDITNPRRGRSVRVKSKRTNSEFSFRYTTLDQLTDLTRPLLAAQGVLAMQPVTAGEDGKPRLLTRLLHASGQWIEGDCPLPPMRGDDLQDFGSAITYVRRYTLAPMLGLASEEDDDGANASGKVAQDQRNRQERLQEEANRSVNPNDPEALRQIAIAKAKAASDGKIADAIDMVRFWAANTQTLDALRIKETPWLDLTRATFMALKRTTKSQTVAVIWAAIAKAEHSGDVDTFDHRYKTEWDGTIDAIRKEAPDLMKALNSYAQNRLTPIREIPPPSLMGEGAASAAGQGGEKQGQREAAQASQDDSRKRERTTKA